MNEQRTRMREQQSPEASARPKAFRAASISLVAVFAASAAPIPVFNVYRAEDGITTADLSLSVVAYFAGTVTALLCLGRLANHVGRRPASLATVLTMVAGSTVLIGVNGAAPLVGGRFLMGLGAGLASSALTTYVVDSAPRRPPWLASVVTSQASQVGLTVGALLSGTVVQYMQSARVVVYLVMIALLAVCLCLLLAAPETGQRAPGVWLSLRPQVWVPPHVRPLLPVAACIFTSTWALGAFYQSFAPTIARDQLHTDSALIVALLFSAYMAPSVVGAPLGGRLTPATAQRVGMLVFLAGVTGILAFVLSASAIGLIAATAVASIGQGIAMSSSLRALLHSTRPSARASLLSAVFLICYSGAMLPTLVSGQLSRILDTPTIAFGYGFLALVGTVVTLIWARNPSGTE